MDEGRRGRLRQGDYYEPVRRLLQHQGKGGESSLGMQKKRSRKRIMTEILLRQNPKSMVTIYMGGGSLRQKSKKIPRIPA